MLLELYSQPTLLEAKIVALKQLKFLFGVNSFVSDIIDFEQKNKYGRILDAPIIKIARFALMMGNKDANSIIKLHQKSCSLLDCEAQSSGYLDFVIRKTSQALKV